MSHSPPPAASTAFPSLGARFSSVNTFKLAAYRACLAQDVTPDDHVGSSTHAYIRCRLPSLSTVSDIWFQGDNCTFFVGASNRDCAAFREVKVNRIDLEHTCDPAARAAHAARERAELERKIARMEAKVAEEEREDAVREELLRAPGPSGRAPGTKTSRAAKAEGEARRRAPEATPRRSQHRRAEQSLESSSASEYASDDDDERSAGGSGGARYPSATQLRKQVARLLEAGDVPFPSRDQSFDSSSALFAVFCSRGHHRYAKTSGGQCLVRVEAKVDDDGRWGVTRAALEHSHELTSATAPIKGGARGPRGRKRPHHEVDSSSPRAASTPPPPGSRPESSGLLAPASRAVQPRSSPLPNAASSSTPAAAVPALLTAVLPDLAPAQIASMASTLAGAGVSTAQDLGSFLYMEGSSVEHMDEEARRREGDFGRTWSFAGLQEALRGACAET